MLELQQGFMVLADTIIDHLAQSRDSSTVHAQDRSSWEERLLELDTVNRSHIEHLDRKFHELNVWQQRVESMAQGVQPACIVCPESACVGHTVIILLSSGCCLTTPVMRNWLGWEDLVRNARLPCRRQCQGQ